MYCLSGAIATCVSPALRGLTASVPKEKVPIEAFIGKTQI